MMVYRLRLKTSACHLLLAASGQVSRCQPCFADCSIVDILAYWRFNVYSEVRINPKDGKGLEYLSLYISRNPFSLETEILSEVQ